MSNIKRGSIVLARSLCYEIAGQTDEDDDMTGSGYGSVDVAEILSAEVERLREENEMLLRRGVGYSQQTMDAVTKERDALKTLCVRWLRKWQNDMDPTPEMLDETHALLDRSHPPTCEEGGA